MSRGCLFTPLILFSVFAFWVAPFLFVLLPPLILGPEKQIECNWDFSKTRMADAMGWPKWDLKSQLWAPRCSILKVTLPNRPTATYLNVWPWLFKSGPIVTGFNIWFPNESADKVRARALRLVRQWNLDTPYSNITLDQWFARVTHENPDHDMDPNWNGPISHPGSFPTISLLIRYGPPDWVHKTPCWCILLQFDFTPVDQPVTAAEN